MTISSPLVAILTDFGLSDSYVAAMKAVLLQQCPDARFVDMTHNIPPQNVRAGAFQLLVNYKNFPKETLFLCVVDPGVGTKRRIIYAETKSYMFVGPDNGLLSWVFSEEKPNLVVDISNPPNWPLPVSGTFHGRDIMAPMAGKILNGEPPQNFGPAVPNWEKIPFPPVVKTGTLWSGEIITVDGFGNLVTNIHMKELDPYADHSRVWIDVDQAGQTIRGISPNYESVAKGKLLAVAGSSGFLEISARDANAAKITGWGEGDPIKVRFRT